MLQIQSWFTHSIQRFVFATEETTAIQQVSHRPNKCQFQLWLQRGIKVNGSHHGDNPLLRPTGIQIPTKNYAPLQVMAPTNVKTVHQTSLILYREQPRSTRNCCRLPTTSVLSNKADKLRSILIPWEDQCEWYIMTKERQGRIARLRAIS